MQRIVFKNFKIILVFFIVILLIGFIINSSTSILRASYPLKFKETVYKHAVQHNIDPLLVFSIIKAESSFDPKARSYKNARGLMQISEVTGDWGAKTLNIEKFNIEKLFDPEINIYIGCWYINRLMKEYNNNLDLVLAAYNGGSGNVNAWLKNRNYSKTGNSLDVIPFKETKLYVKKVKNNYEVYRKLYRSR